MALPYLPVLFVEDRPVRHGVAQGPEGAVAAAVVVLGKVSGVSDSTYVLGQS